MTWLQIPRPSDDRFEWQREPDGATSVLSRPRDWQAYSLPAPDAHSKRTEQWIPLAMGAGERHNVPPHWILGFIYSESGGDTDPPPNGYNVHGLMQINAVVAKVDYGVELPALLEPATNIDTGARFIARCRAKIDDLVQIASMYNAGPSAETGLAKRSTKNSWGFVSNVDYIDHIVMASNYFLPFVRHFSPTTTTTVTFSGPTLASLACVGMGAYYIAKKGFGR